MTKGGDGEYVITLPEPADNCTIQTSLYGSFSSSAAADFIGAVYEVGGWVYATHDQTGEADEVEVFTGYDDGTSAFDVDLNFSFTAFCSDPQLTLILPGIPLFPIFTP